jgi:hypothetical protein
MGTPRQLVLHVKSIGTFLRNAVAALMVGLVLLLAFITIANNEFYGRLTETEEVPPAASGGAAAESAPHVLLVLHHLLHDENAVEASVVIEIEASSPFAQSLRDRDLGLECRVRDGMGTYPYLVLGTCTLDSSALAVRSGTLWARSARFVLPTQPTVEAFPFDDILIRPALEIVGGDGFGTAYSASIQKAFSGRLLRVTASGGMPDVRLSRTGIERAVVIIVTLVFLLLCGLVAWKLFSDPRGMTGLQEVAALAGFLLASAGVRDLLGLSRDAGTSLLELGIIVVPLLVLTLGVAYSVFRGSRSSTDGRPLTDR